MTATDPVAITDIDDLCVATIRTLCIDAIQKASSGHPGTAMAMAPTVYTLWQEFLRYDPDDPIWPNRDRFVLSSGHASMLLYSMLHLAQVKAVNPAYETLGATAVTLDDIRSFRQLDSKCPGHPEYRWTSGIEATTGPLGTGVATSVGMAIAGRWMATHFNRPDFEMFDYDVWAQCGDGDMMEGIASEAASMAGHLALSNLCWIYDSNRITIEGSTQLAFTEDVATRFMAYRWNVTRVGDANDRAMLARAFRIAREESDRPTLIIVDSHIGYGAPDKQDTAAAHGAPLGDEEVRKTKQFYGWPPDAQFLVPSGVYTHFDQGVGARGRAARDAWMERFDQYTQQYPDLADQLYRMQHRQLPDGWDNAIPEFPTDRAGLASRDSSAQVLNAVAEQVPWLIGGSADLYPSTKTRLTFAGAGDLAADVPGGRNFHFGIREHAAAAIANGLSLSKVRPFWSTFLIFSDFARGAMRLSALMDIPVIHVFTHDSIGVGEDGPTHQPVEQLAALRAVPGLAVFRPCDANEAAETWRHVMQLRHEPAAIVLSRQKLPTLDRDRYAPASGVARGGYVLADGGDGPLQIIFIATGSEVHLALAAHEALRADGVHSRVVSLPSWHLFDQQPSEYRDEVLPPQVRARVVVEQASTMGWERYAGPDGAIVAMHTFGASAPLKAVAGKFGFTPEAVADVAREQLAAAG